MHLDVDVQVMFKVWEPTGDGYSMPKALCFKHAVQRAMEGQQVDTEVATADDCYSCVECNKERGY